MTQHRKRPTIQPRTWTRRGWLSAAGTGFAVAAFNRDAARADNGGLAGQPPPNQAAPLPLTEFEPRSMLHVRETRVAARALSGDRLSHPRLATPRITETRRAAGRHREGDGRRQPADHGEPHRRHRVRTSPATITNFDHAFPRRFLTMTEPTWDRAGQQGYAHGRRTRSRKAKAAGAMGLKVLKTLGLYLRDGGPIGNARTVDDPRFDPMWEACGALGIPVAMHVGDPEAFFLPIDRFNERYEELSAHPDWSFHGKDFPAFKDVLSARDRVFARHPKTTFVALHVGHWAENLAAVGETLDKFPNVHVEIGARIGELGRQPRTSARFFDKYQDRILFGTDAVPLGTETPQQVFGEELYRIYYRFLETEDEYFDYAPARVPPQGRWKIYGLGLPEPILRKVYHQNAERILGVKLVTA